MVYYTSSYNPDYDVNCNSEELKQQAQEENDKAVKLYKDGLDYYNTGHYDEAISRFTWAKSLAHDRDLINDCYDMIDECNAALAELHMR